MLIPMLTPGCAEASDKTRVAGCTSGKLLGHTLHWGFLLFISSWSIKQILVMCRKLFGQIRSPIPLSKWWVFLQRVERPKTTTTTSPWPTRPTSTCSQQTLRFSPPWNPLIITTIDISLSEEGDAAENSDLLFFKRRPLVLRPQCHHCYGTGYYHYLCFSCFVSSTH